MNQLNSDEPLQEKRYKLHAIQLKNVRVSDLSIHVNLSAPKDAEGGSFTMETGRSAYDKELKQIQVKVAVKIGQDDDKNAPFTLEVVLHGLFSVDETRFNPEFVEDWAEKNAPLVLYPYVREQVYALTARTGFNEALLPLLEIPTYKITPQTGT